MADKLAIYDFTAPGYKPLLRSQGWMVAKLNSDDLCVSSNVKVIERHEKSDEAFILWRGKAAIFTSGENGLQVVEMTPGIVYNVEPGGWHGLLSTQDAAWIIVENVGTDTNGTEVRPMTAAELQQLHAQLPPWA